MLCFAFAMVGSALADDAPGYRYPATFNDLESVNNSPGHNPAPLLSDVEFFGTWDGTKWTSPGLFDYTGHPGLEPVEAAIKRGDYQAAGEALLAYYRNRDAIDLPDLPEADERSKLRAELFMDQVYMRVSPLHQFEVQTTPQSYTFDVTETVRGGKSRFQLTSRKKGSGTARFNSREAGSHNPELRLTLEDGQKTLLAAADTSVQYGAKGGKGGEAELLVRGSKPGVVVDGETCRAMLQFDLKSIAPGTIQKAELVLHGSTDAPSGSMAVVLAPDNWSSLNPGNEAGFAWNHVIWNHFSYEGLSGLPAWRNPKEGNPQHWFFITAIVRFPHYPHIIAMYRKTGDERYARRAIQIYLDYVEYQMFNRLDSGTRVGTLVGPSMALYKSPSMTPQALKIMIEHAWRMGNWFNGQRNWYGNHNYGSSYIAGLGSLAYQFPELRDTAAWWATNNGRALHYTSRGMFGSDHSFLEANTRYSRMVLGFLNQYREHAVKSGVVLPPELVRNFRGIARYAMDVTDPAGLFYPYGNTGDPAGISFDIIKRIAVDHDDAELLFIVTDGKEGTRPVRTSAWYPVTKLGIMRTAWADKNALGLFVNARNGGTHGQANTLSLCAYGYGRQLIDDTYFYPGFNPLRRGVNTVDHNTVAINGQSQGSGGAANGRMLMNPQFDLFDGYTDATGGFRHRRRILLVKSAKFWIVSDRLHAKAQPDATHRYNQTWHPRPASGVAIEEQTKVAATAFPTLGNIKIVPADPQELKASLPEGWWSNDRHTYVSYEREAKGSATFDTVLYPIPEGADADVTVTRLDTGVPTMDATALRLDIRDSTGTRTGWYYLSYEEKPGERAVGPLTTDARMLYFDHDERGRLTLLLEQGTAARHETHPHPLVEAESPADDLAVEWNADEKSIRISTGDREATLAARIYAPFTAEHVTVNEKAVAYSQQESLVTIHP